MRISNKVPETYFQELLSQVSGGESIHGGISSKEDLLENLKENCIPESVFGMTHENYEEFLLERRKLMAARIRDYYRSL